MPCTTGRQGFLTPEDREMERLRKDNAKLREWYYDPPTVSEIEAVAEVLCKRDGIRWDLIGENSRDSYRKGGREVLLAAQKVRMAR
jgi:hypothetical protein